MIFFAGQKFVSVKNESRNAINKLTEKRSFLIKNSLYKTHLKYASDRKTENQIISNFVDSRRIFWNFPEAFPLDQQFVIVN